MASKQGGVPFNGGAPKYINDFSKALAGEVRILLQEVGKLRDERRQLQHEIAELMAVKSKHGGGGEYAQEWMPPQFPAIEGPPPPSSAPPAEEVVAARPGWRTVVKRPDPPAPGTSARRRAKAAAAPPPPPEPPKPELPSWAQWRPNPLLSPAPRNASHGIASPPPRNGLFGPSTPPPQ